MVVSGFEPLDVLYALVLILRQISNEDPKVENGYERAVDYEGNWRSLQLIKEVFRKSDSTWRGIGEIPDSGLALKSDYKRWDAREKFDIDSESGEEFCRTAVVLK